MKNHLNKKNGMILGEVIFALFLCGILLGISIHMFRSNDVSKTPFIYQVLKNLPVANKAVMQDCYNSGICTNQNELPDSVIKYCTLLTENVLVTGETNCTTDGSDTVKIAVGSSSYGLNFRFINGTAFYNMTPKGDWETLDSGSEYIDAFIDINGPNSGENTLGSDIFPIRIFKNGEVIPSIVKDKFDATDDEEFFSYRAVVDKASDDKNVNIRTRTALDARDDNQINNNLPFREKISFIEAMCITNPNSISRYFDSTDTDCNGYTILDACDFDDGDSTTYPHLSDPTAFCTVEPVRPRATGIFKIFGI